MSSVRSWWTKHHNPHRNRLRCRYLSQRRDTGSPIHPDFRRAQTIPSPQRGAPRLGRRSRLRPLSASQREVSKSLAGCAIARCTRRRYHRLAPLGFTV